MKSIKFLTVLALFVLQSTFIDESRAIQLNRKHHDDDDDDEKVESIAQTESETEAEAQLQMMTRVQITNMHKSLHMERNYELVQKISKAMKEA